MRCNIELSTLVIAVFKAVFAAIAIIALAIALGVMNFAAKTDFYIPQTYLNVICSVILVLSVIHFIFVVLLCNGICKKNVDQIKVYFIYGVVQAIVAGLVTIILTAVESVGIVLIIPIAIHCLFLHMVNVTYSKMNAELKLFAPFSAENEIYP